MIISIKISPVVVTARTKDELIEKISEGGFFVRKHTQFGNGLSHSKTNIVKVYNLQKLRRKTSQPPITYNKQGKRVRLRKDLVREGHWVAYVYCLDKAVLRAAGLMVRQDHRGFSLLNSQYGKPNFCIFSGKKLI